MKNKAKNLRKFRSVIAAVGVLCAGSVQAGTAVFDFNEDPQAGGLLTIYGGSYWYPTGGAGVATNANDGYLAVTDAVGSQSGAIVFADFDNGQVVKAFTFEADFRIGNGTENPADGFSVSYVRSNDPILESIASGGSPTGWAQGQNCEANLPEEGTQTGISIGFDAWDSGGTAGGLCDVASQDIGLDVAGLTVRVDKTLVAQFPMPTRNGACNDARSVQTGPYDAANPGSPDGLCWAPLKIELKEDGKLNVWWKGTQLLTNYQTDYFPSAGALVFGGRTGGSHQNQHVDNIRITTIGAALALVGQATGHPLGFSIVVNDSGASVVDTTKPITLKLNGATVTPTSVTKNGGLTTVTYRGAAPLAAGANNTVDLTVTDGNNNTISGTQTFVTPAYLTLPPSFKVASVDTAAPGFLVQPYKTALGNPNRLYWTDLQLLGLWGPNLGTMTTANYNGVLDFSNTTTPGNNGQFTNDFQWSVFGLPVADPDTANLSVAAMAYAHFPQAGLYTFGGNSDDGIRLTFAKNAQDLLGLEVPGMTVDVGRGIAANQNTGYVWIPEAGYYGFRFLFENGGGGSDMEFYTKSTPAGGDANILVNASDANALKVYRSSAVAPAYVSFANPPLMHNQVGGGQDITLKITDAATTVQPAGVTLKLDGVAQVPATAKVGNVTTVTLPAPLNGWALGEHTIELSFNDGTTTHTYSYKFTVNQSLFVLNPALAAPLGSQDNSKPGFAAKIVQTDKQGTLERPNFIYVGEQTVAGYWGENKAGVTNFDVPGVINFDIGPANQGFFNADNGFPEELFPGLPGSGGAPNEQFAMTFKTWLEFKTNGVYQLNFNSDDGFLLSLGHDEPVNNGQLEITAPASLARGVPTLWGNDAGINITSNTTPVTGNLVVMRSSDTLGCDTPANAAQLAGNIAIAERGVCGFSIKAKAAYDAGAKAILIVQNRPEVTAEEGWFPIEPGVTDPPGRLPIPVVMIDRANYIAITNALATGTVTATLRPFIRAGTPVFEANYGKGASDITQFVRVTQPGLYPVRVMFWQGGGGGNAEFEQHFADGTRALINDTNHVAALRAFQSVSFVRPVVSIATEGNVVRINYTGTLQGAPTANGPYTDVTGASSPYTVDTTTGMRFFRAR